MDDWNVEHHGHRGGEQEPSAMPPFYHESTKKLIITDTHTNVLPALSAIYVVLISRDLPNTTLRFRSEAIGMN